MTRPKPVLANVVTDLTNCWGLLNTPPNKNGVITINLGKNKLEYRKSCKLEELTTKYCGDKLRTVYGTEFSKDFMLRGLKVLELMHAGRNPEVWECHRDGKVYSQYRPLTERPVLLVTEHASVMIAPRVGETE